MLFVTLAKVRTNSIDELKDAMEKFKRSENVKVHHMMLLMGRYDALFVFEAPNEVVASRAVLSLQQAFSTETALATPIEKI